MFLGKARPLTTRAEAAVAALFILAMWLNPVIAVAITSASADTGVIPGQVHCADHACCRRGHHAPVSPATQAQLRSSCCGGACCAFGQIVILKLGHFLPASPQMGISFASQPAVPAERFSVVVTSRDTALFQRPPPALAVL